MEKFWRRGLIPVGVAVFGEVGIWTVNTPFVPTGWTFQKKCDNRGFCWTDGAVPDGGHWLSFRIGMSHEEAVTALCEAVDKGNIFAEEGGPVSLKDGRCVIRPLGRNIAGGLNTTKGDIWKLHARGFWGGCFPLAIRRDLWFEFDDTDGRLQYIQSSCPPFDP